MKTIKARLEININQDHLGLARVFNELQILENRAELNEQEVKELKRRYLLSILYQYSSEMPLPSSSEMAGILFQPAHVAAGSLTNSVANVVQGTTVTSLRPVNDPPKSETSTSLVDPDIAKASVDSLNAGNYSFYEHEP